MRGVLLFAFNNTVTDYYDMAVKTARRVEHFLKLPVTIVTDSVPLNPEFNVINVPAVTSNQKNNTPWFNKGRHRAFELSPYDETILLDTDYLINSSKLLQLFDIYENFMCHGTTYYLTEGDNTEYVSPTSFATLWATVIIFDKSERSKHIFECLRMVQENYQHYINLYQMQSPMYRNDYGITIASRIVDGHWFNQKNLIPWKLTHVNSYLNVIKNSSDPFNTSYTIINDRGLKAEYIKVKDMDFHCMNKTTFMEIVT